MDHFHELFPFVKEISFSSHFEKDMGSLDGFDPKKIFSHEFEDFTRLHKFEEKIGEHYIFRALHEGKHIVYSIDRNGSVVFLRAFSNFKEYGKFLGDKKKIGEILKLY
jgi:mRNA-degrading endonuclease RelE of RelBE toxin-antitoxin system